MVLAAAGLGSSVLLWQKVDGMQEQLARQTADSGTQATEGYAAIRADLCFLGVTGLHPDTGLTTGHPEEAQLKARMIRSAAETVVLATPDKLGATSPFRIATLEAATTLIAPGPAPDWLPASTRHLQA